jgi:CubicO group peptidase (beta-lactamase class C family)
MGTALLLIGVCWSLVERVEAEDGAAPLPRSRFAAVHRLLTDEVDRQHVAGAVAIVVHKERVAYSTAVGLRDREAGATMTPDTIFRIASMTKPITSVAVLMLRDEGRLALDDPLSKFVPEFAAPKVVRIVGGEEPSFVPARREITIRDLLTHTSGITYGFLGSPVVGDWYAREHVSDGLIETPGAIADNVRRLAKAPLCNQPGAAWQYGLSADVLGRVVEVASGKTLDQFFRERIFQPLSMNDTHFVLSADKHSRLAACYRPRKEGGLERVGDGPQTANGLTYSATYSTKGGSYFSGGVGLVSTAADFARFLQMLQSGGELQGVRLLKADSVAEMTRNQIGALDCPFTLHGDKFGFGVGVHSPASKDRHGASDGTYSWGGIFNTHFWVDPQEQLIGVLMTQLFPNDHLSLRTDFQDAVYHALHSGVRSDVARGPRPGDVYREFAIHNGGNKNWRVHDPNARAEGAKQFLPNPLLRISVGDLTGAIRAEALLDRWGGHIKTADRKIRFNENAWLDVPTLTTPPEGRADYYYFEDNPIIEVPLSHLMPGDNTLEGTCGARDNSNWGQWGLYSLVLRVYYDPATRPPAIGRIVSPQPGGTLSEDPTIVLECPPNTRRADVLAWYDGYDENGDGVYRDWHGGYFQPLRGEPAVLADHVGTATRAPWSVGWKTRWVPDQPPGGVQLVARVQRDDGTWSVTPIVDGLSLKRIGESVRMYRPRIIPERFGVRMNQRQSCSITVGDDFDPSKVIEAALALRTWHGWDGHHEPLQLNDVSFPLAGNNHHYAFKYLAIPADAIRSGENTFAIHSKTEHHMLEVLWPGPALLVRLRN